MRDLNQTNKGREPRKQSEKTLREDRLKAALKANMGRRKAQVKARAANHDDNHDDSGSPQMDE